LLDVGGIATDRFARASKTKVELQVMLGGRPR